MNDWRSKPRTGKSQVVPWRQLIQARIDLGATMKQVFDELVADGSITLGYRQFVRYVNELKDSAARVGQVHDTIRQALPEANPAPANSKGPSQKIPGKPVASTEQIKQAGEPKAAPRPPMTPADFRKIREDFDKMDLNALVTGKGIIYDK